MATKTRIEHDTMGPVKVPADRLWGAQTQRSLHHFHFPGETMPLEVVRALQQTNTSVSAGFINEGGQEFLVHGVGRVRRAEDVGETLVAERAGELVLIRQLGEVQIGAGLRRKPRSARSARLPRSLAHWGVTDTEVISDWGAEGRSS